MTIRTFWTFLLKILGISLALKGVNVILQLCSTLLLFSTASDFTMNFVWGIAPLFFAVAAYIFILWGLVFKTNWIIDKLRLENGFKEERIDLNIQLSTMLTIATIIIGGIMIINSLPLLCKHILGFFQQDITFQKSPTTGWIILYGVESVLGYLLMTNSKVVVAFIEKQSSKEKEGDQIQ